MPTLVRQVGKREGHLADVFCPQVADQSATFFFSSFFLSFFGAEHETQHQILSGKQMPPQMWH